jgi:hypothetical protein
MSSKHPQVRRTKTKAATNKQPTTASLLQKLPIYNTVLSKLLEGAPCSQLATWIKEQGYFADMKTPTLRKALDRLRRAEQKMAKPLSPVKAQPAPQPVAVQEDGSIPDDDGEYAPVLVPAEVVALEELAGLQQDRINLLHGNEKKIGHLFPQGKQEIGELRAILHTLFDKKREMGLPGYGGPRQEAPRGDTNITVNNIGELTQQTLQVLCEPKSRRRILDALHSLGAKGEVDSALLEKRLGRNVIDHNDRVDEATEVPAAAVR